MNGIYVHVPYCLKKCGYCDFYSVCDLSSADDYVEAICREINNIDEKSDTLYIGGGTPSLLSALQIIKIINAAKSILTDDAEITIEVNPGDDLTELLPKISASGVNRLSIGMQSHCDRELELLTRRHNSSDVDNAITLAKKCGINNISLDVMIGIEGQTLDSLKDTLDFCAESGITHVSAYMLKIESGTPFEKAEYRPIDDAQADMYLFAVDYLAKLGFEQYEISNFCRHGMHSRHNLKYWIGDSYIGIGAAAHSYYKGRRSFYSRSITDFITGVPAVDDGAGGTFEEAVMLGLRLNKGINCDELVKLYPTMNNKIKEMLNKANALSKTKLVSVEDNIITLTVKGFLVSNSIIGMLLE